MQDPSLEADDGLVQNPAAPDGGAAADLAVPPVPLETEAGAETEPPPPHHFMASPGHGA